MSSSQSAIAKTYTVQTNGHNTANKAKKPSHGSHSVSVNCNTTSANYSNTFAYLVIRIMNNTSEPALTYLSCLLQLLCIVGHSVCIFNDSFVLL